MAALVFGPDDVQAASPGRPGSFVWPHAGIGLLRSPAVRLAMAVRAGRRLARPPRQARRRRRDGHRVVQPRPRDQRLRF
ncbi:hypothetical protein [Nonomuraea dietziae]|uniref:hypothetical protein n=1 Tax=Nonomuraea dietziae TaxID=65515 RepID=UPI0031DB5B96